MEKMYIHVIISNLSIYCYFINILFSIEYKRGYFWIHFYCKINI